MHEEIGGPGEVFGSRVRQLRKRIGLSQAELAKRVATHPGVDLDQSKIARLEAGKRPVRLEEAVALARVLDSMVDVMVIPDVSLEDEIARLEEYIQACWAAATNAGAEFEEAQGRLQRLRDLAEGGAPDGEHREEA